MWWGLFNMYEVHLKVKEAWSLLAKFDCAGTANAFVDGYNCATASRNVSNVLSVRFVEKTAA